LLFLVALPGLTKSVEPQEPSPLRPVAPSTSSLALGDSITVLHQRDPIEGAAASESTVVRVSRDGDRLLINVVAFDRSPDAIVASQLRRDADLSSDDNVTVLIDSYYDRRSAFLFSTNPYGAMWDAQLAGGSLNPDWNGIWDVHTSRGPAGWTAQFEIPLRTLRFRSNSDGVFGFNVRRVIRRKNEEALWSGWKRTEGLTQLASEGELTHVGELRRSRNIEVTPYALAQAIEPAFSVAGDRASTGAAAGKIGADAKIGLASSLTADLTINTDFAQVEADSQVINLTRFPLFFPEKREFFLESSGIFDFGASEVAQLFYSRRVGLKNGSPVPILGGARVTGRAGPWTLGILDARTGGSDEANDAVVRVRRDIFGRGYIGAIATSRSGPGVSASQQSGGIDAALPLILRGQNLVPSAFLAATSGDHRPAVWAASLDYPNDFFNGFMTVSRVASGFSPDLGFVPQAGILRSSGVIDLQPRPDWRGIRQLGFRIVPGWQIITDENGSLFDAARWQSGLLSWHPLAVTFQSGDNVSFGIQRWLDHPPTPFEIVPGVTIAPGAYWYSRGTFSFTSSSARAVSGAAAFSGGQFYAGHSETEQASISIRGTGHIRLTQSVANTSAHLPEGKFDALVVATRFEYAVTTRVNALGFVQYNNATNRADFNLRLHWIPSIGDDVYIVWNSGYATGEDAAFRFPSVRSATRPLNGALILKAAHRLAF
jgi:hypothetical protein